uniref:FYR C-terminal domain-containing protein n=1 Tax=Ascaris lumbricoides TaxID=6252 RepID=A0A0M3HPQ2_ASCLU
MIGMLNCGSENTADFYASPRESSLYQKGRVRTRSTVGYSSDGRKFVDGQPLDKCTPSEMWHEVLKKASVTSVIERSLLHIENEPTAVSDSELETKKASKNPRNDISSMWQQVISDVRARTSKNQTPIEKSRNREQSVTSAVEERLDSPS